MKKLISFLMFLAFVTTSAIAQTSFRPPSWTYNSTTKVYSQNDGLQLYKHERSSQHFDVYYGVGYGTTPPEKLAKSNALYVDVDDLLEKAEMFFELNVNKLKFADLSVSKLNDYKMIICILHDTGWTATGSGYDNKIGALWVTPSTCHPVGQTIGHEIGHAFQYQVFCDLGGYTGFRGAVGNGSTFWEQTAQWQSVQAYPELMMDQSIGVWKNSHNYAFTHEWHRYQSYWLHYYWAQKHGIDAVGKVWRGGTVQGEDPCQVYMRVFNVSVEDFFKEIYDYASHMATYDLDAVRKYGEPYIGSYRYSCIDMGDGKLQVAFSSCPQSTGFNVIPLEVPAAGTEIKCEFTALSLLNLELAPNDPAEYLNDKSEFVKSGKTTYSKKTTNYRNRGFRHGYVALLNDGTRVYSSEDCVYGTENPRENETDVTSFVVPENTKKLYFIVSPAPKTYNKHLWDEKVDDGDEQWPYQIKFENTDVIGYTPNIDLSDETILPSETTIEVNVGFNADASNYTGTTFTPSSKQLRQIGEALRIQPSQVANLMATYSSSQAKSSIHFVALNPTTTNAASSASTANGYGHWFDAKGSVCNWGTTAYVFSEFAPSTLTFSIGQYPGHCKNGQVYKIGQGLRYKDANGNVGIAKFIFNVYIGGVPVGIETVNIKKASSTGIYDLTGRKYSSSDNLRPGVYIMDGKKHIVK
ncbi:MAG: DUF4859 domain-containing protein [Prevotellaceae bacterium]|nr:DUF4859 domain-containing protein [Candidatus Minthosoma equi]